jgi:hypothetical protein
MAKKIGKGKAIEELVKGSLEYTRREISDAFGVQFPWDAGTNNYDIVDTFADYVIAQSYGDINLASDEYYKISYIKSGDAYVFAPRDQWEVVELTYQPQTMMTESKKKSGHRFEEAVRPAQVQLLEAQDPAKGTRRIRINDLVVANKINGNKRLYSSDVVEAMVADWQSHLHESAGQGRLKILTGEVEHPTDKGKKHAEYLETVVRWDTLDWNGERLNIEGDLILTSKGKDVAILMEAGVNPGGSIRCIGESKVEKVGGEKIEKVLWVSMNGADLVGDPSFKNSAELQESTNHQGDEDMNIEELIKFLKEHPDVLKGLTEAHIREMGESQLKSLEESLRAKLGIGKDADIAKVLDESMSKAKQFDEMQVKSAVETAITEACKELPFGDKLNKLFIEALKTSGAKTADEVKVIAESKRKEYGAMAAEFKLSSMGFGDKGSGVYVIGDVLESETGVPEFARASFEIKESIRKHDNRPMKDLRKNESPAALWTLKLLARFDVENRQSLLQEARMFNEAEAASDLNLPYNYSRAMIMEAFPTLVAANIFDMGVMNVPDERIYFERFVGETGFEVDITNEVVTGGAEGTWYAMTHNRVVPGTAVVTSNPAGTTYDEGDDFIIDYELGKIKFLTPGDIGANDVLVTYTYRAIRLGEDVEIERAKMQLDYQLVTAAADRVSDYITDEAIRFSRATLGWDAVARTMANMVQQIRLDIDRGLIEKALGPALGVASNSGGTWTVATDPWSLLAEYIGYAKVKVGKRYYKPTFVLSSETNADLMSNWDGFTRQGFPNALLDAEGFVGGVKGLPWFKTTEMRDSWILVGNRQQVSHRVFNPMLIKGPFQTFGANRKLVAAEQYYAEEYNASICPIPEKAAVVKVV